MEIDKEETAVTVSFIGEPSLEPTPPKPKVRVIKKVIKRVPKSSSANSTVNHHHHSGSSATHHHNTTSSNISNSINNTHKRLQHHQQHNGKSELDVDADVDSLDSEAVTKRKEELRKMITDKVMIDKKTFETQSILIDNIVTELDLKKAALYMQPNHYDDVVIERSLTKICGYPTCDKTVLEKKPYKYYISTKDQKVYDQEELANFCSTDCLTKSKLYRFTLDKTPVHLRKLDNVDIIESPEQKLAHNIEENLTIKENEHADNAPINSNFGTFNSDTPITKVDRDKDIEREIETNEQITVTDELNHQFSKMLCDEESSSTLLKPPSMTASPLPMTDDDKSTNGDDFHSEDEDDEDDGTSSLPRSNYSDIDIDSVDSGREDDSAGGLYGFIEKGASKQLPISNYHSVYSPLSEWRTNYTEQYLRSNNEEHHTRTDQSAQIKQTLHHYLSLYFSSVVKALHIQDTLTTHSLASLIDTFSLTRPIPSLSPNNWRMIILVLIKSISYKYSNLEKELEKNSQIFERLLKDYGFDKYYLNVFVDLMINGYS